MNPDNVLNDVKRFGVTADCCSAYWSFFYLASLDGMIVGA
jgi:hypothetical protein